MEHRQENQTMDGKFIPMTSLTNGLVQQVAEGVFSYTIQIVNIAMVRTSNDFVLIDTGMPESEKRFLKLLKKYLAKMQNRKPSF